MAAHDNPLTVFVSSTIDDFGDLRWALKVWLEELGLADMMSEYTDSGREPERDSFDSCFEVIDQCDYFLLIGRRKGSPYGAHRGSAPYAVWRRRSGYRLRNSSTGSTTRLRKREKRPPDEARVDRFSWESFSRQGQCRLRMCRLYMGRSDDRPVSNFDSWVERATTARM
jgi:hypothetical protein